MVTVELPRLIRTGQREGRLMGPNCSETVWISQAICANASKTRGVIKAGRPCHYAGNAVAAAIQFASAHAGRVNGCMYWGSLPTLFIASVIWRFCFIIPPMKPCSSLMAAVAFFFSLSLRLLAAEPEVSEQDLPRVPPTEPNNAIATVQMKKG